jgi:hypothetical protein
MILKHIENEGAAMNLLLLGGPSGNGGSPRLWIDLDQGIYYVQGWKVPGAPDQVEIPHILLSWLRPGTHLGTTLTDSGTGTFTLSGPIVTDPDALALMQIPGHETAVRVPAAETPKRW